MEGVVSTDIIIICIVISLVSIIISLYHLIYKHDTFISNEKKINEIINKENVSRKIATKVSKHCRKPRYPKKIRINGSF